MNKILINENIFNSCYYIVVLKLYLYIEFNRKYFDVVIKWFVI